MYLDVRSLDPSTGKLMRIPDKAASLPPERGVFFVPTRTALGVKLPAPAVALYRDGEDVFVQAGRTRVRLREGATRVDHVKGSSRTAVTVEDEGVTLAFSYGNVELDELIRLDTTFDDDQLEDFDFGLLVKNVVQEPGRISRWFRADPESI